MGKKKKFSDGLSEPRRHKPYEKLKHISGPKPKPAREPGRRWHWTSPAWMRKITGSDKKRKESWI